MNDIIQQGMCEICGKNAAVFQTSKNGLERSEFQSAKAKKADDSSINLCEECAKNDIKEFLDNLDGNPVQVGIMPNKHGYFPKELIDEMQRLGLRPIGVGRMPKQDNTNALTRQEMLDLGFTEEEIDSVAIRAESEVVANKSKNSLNEFNSLMSRIFGQSVSELEDDPLAEDISQVFSDFKNMFENFPKEAKEIRDDWDKNNK